MVIDGQVGSAPSGNYLYVIENPAGKDFDIVIKIPQSSSGDVKTIGLYYFDSVVGDDGLMRYRFLTSPVFSDSPDDIYVSFREGDGSSPLAVSVVFQDDFAMY